MIRRAQPLLLLVVVASLAACDNSTPSTSQSDPATVAARATLVDAWVRAAPAGRRMTAAYVTINNPTSTVMIIEGAVAEGFARAELHTTIMEDDVARMRQLDNVEVAAESTLRFEPGARHIMLMGAERSLDVAGEDIAITLATSTHGTLTVLAPLRREAP